MRWGWGRFVLVTALLSGVTTALALIWVLSSRDTAAAAATVSAAVLTLAVPLLPWARKDMAVQPDQLAANLAAAALAQWQAEADKRQLRDPQPLTVRWSGADATLMDDPDVIAPEPMGQRHGLRHRALGTRLSLTGGIDQVDVEFRKIPGRRLVVIGQPGAGKTGVLVMLTLKLLERWKPNEPVPILLTVSSWNSRREPLLDWLPRQLADEYSFL